MVRGDLNPQGALGDENPQLEEVAMAAAPVTASGEDPYGWVDPEVLCILSKYRTPGLAAIDLSSSLYLERMSRPDVYIVVFNVIAIVMHFAGFSILKLCCVFSWWSLVTCCTP